MSSLALPCLFWVFVLLSLTRLTCQCSQYITCVLYILPFVPHVYLYIYFHPRRGLSPIIMFLTYCACFFWLSLPFSLSALGDHLAGCGLCHAESPQVHCELHGGILGESIQMLWRGHPFVLHWIARLSFHALSFIFIILYHCNLHLFIPLLYLSCIYYLLLYSYNSVFKAQLSHSRVGRNFTPGY